MPVWVGGGSVATTELAVEIGGAVNLWEGQPATLAGLVARCEVTWGGPVPGDVAQIALWLSELARSGCSWAVCAWPDSVEDVAEAARVIRVGG